MRTIQLANLRQGAFYLVVGGGTALAYIAVCSLLTMRGVKPGLASIIGYLLAIIPAYLGQRKLTFRSTAWHRVAFPKYLVVQLIGNIAAYFVSELLIAHMQVRAWIAFGVVAVMIALTNFLVLKNWTFRDDEA